MVTAVYQKIATRIGKFTFFNVFDPGAIDANGHVMFRFTGNSTGMAAYTLALVNNKSVFHNKIDISLLLLLRDIVYRVCFAQVHKITHPILSVEKKPTIV